MQRHQAADITLLHRDQISHRDCEIFELHLKTGQAMNLTQGFSGIIGLPSGLLSVQCFMQPKTHFPLLASDSHRPGRWDCGAECRRLRSPMTLTLSTLCNNHDADRQGRGGTTACLSRHCPNSKCHNSMDLDDASSPHRGSNFSG
jgi:hypothetical protein